MAQTEDTELRDMVIEALEKNGSLAKIRALLRANIFLAFEDQCENLRHNMSLDAILKVPEGILALSIVHEFLEFCNLKNTLFVYKSESCQGKEYRYEGRKSLYEKLNLNKTETREPVLVTLIKSAMKLNYSHSESSILKRLQESSDNVCKDDHNSSYIVHEDSQSSTNSTSQSDNSIDEKNKLHLRLHLDNSDTDTSSDSSRGKSASEYIPSQHIMEHKDNSLINEPSVNIHISPQKQEVNVPNYFTKVAGNTSSESTSYIDLKPFSTMDEKMLNTPGLPAPDENDEKLATIHSDRSNSEKSATMSSVPSLSLRNDQEKTDVKKVQQESPRSDVDTAEYSNDFSVSQESKNHKSESQISPHANDNLKVNLSSRVLSPHNNSHSSVSISDVADLLSDRSSSFDKHSNNEKSPGKSNFVSKSINRSPRLIKLTDDDSGDFTDSPIPSLSNLSLDIHSD